MFSCISLFQSLGNCSSLMENSFFWSSLSTHHLSLPSSVEWCVGAAGYVDYCGSLSEFTWQWRKKIGLSTTPALFWHYLLSLRLVILSSAWPTSFWQGLIEVVSITALDSKLVHLSTVEKMIDKSKKAECTRFVLLEFRLSGHPVTMSILWWPQLGL